MKKLVYSMALAFISASINAQIVNVGKTLNNALVNQTNNQIYSASNQGVSSVFSAPGKIFRKIKSSVNSGSANSNSTATTTAMNTTVQSGTNTQVGNSPGVISKSGTSDFLPAKEIVLTDNFSSTTAGEFPSNWMTNSSGEVRTINGQEGQWLQISSNGIFSLDQPVDLPENFTIEYDAIFHPTPSKDVHYIFYLYSQKDKVADFKETSYPGNAGIYFAFNTAAGEVDAENFEGGKPGIIDTHLATDLLKSELANKIHVAFARQKSKLSLYINGAKVFSSPNALPANYTYNAIKFGSFFMGNDDFMLVSNVTIAHN